MSKFWDAVTGAAAGEASEVEPDPVETAMKAEELKAPESEAPAPARLEPPRRMTRHRRKVWLSRERARLAREAKG